MNAVATEPVSNNVTKLLVFLSVAGFWLLPFSPFVSIGAVSMTNGKPGWPRNLAITGAVLCVTYTVIITIAIVTTAVRTLVLHSSW